MKGPPAERELERAQRLAAAFDEAMRLAEAAAASSAGRPLPEAPPLALPLAVFDGLVAREEAEAARASRRALAEIAARLASRTYPPAALRTLQAQVAELRAALEVELAGVVATHAQAEAGLARWLERMRVAAEAGRPDLVAQVYERCDTSVGEIGDLETLLAELHAQRTELVLLEARLADTR